jgi:hypothetical protein
MKSDKVEVTPANEVSNDKVERRKVGRPTKITPEKMAKIRELAPTNSASEIGILIDLKQSTVSYLCHRYNIQLGRTSPGSDRLTARVKKEVVIAFAKEACERNITVDSLVYRLLTRIAEDNIFEAVLDERPRVLKNK